MIKIMKVEDIIKKYDSGERLKMEIFNEGAFSQFEKSFFKIKDVNYFCVEQYLLANRARLFKDKEMLQKIMESKSIRQAKLFGNKIRNFNQDELDKHKLNMSYVANLCKFQQDENLKFKLLETENSILVNADAFDPVWGIQKKITDLDIKNPHSWKGKNLLGFILMEIREEFKQKLHR